VYSWLVRLGLAPRSPLRFSRLGHGHSNLTFLVTDAGGAQWVLRRPPLGHLLASAHDIAREHRILAALERTAVPTPRVLGFSESEFSDAPVLAMEYVDGVVTDERALLEAKSLRTSRTIAAALADTLARIHQVDLEQSGLLSLSSHGSYAARQLKRWHRQWEHSRTRALPAIDDLATRLAAAMPQQEELTLVHGDFHLENLITSPSDGSVRAVVDWELCTLGDPLADLGGLLAYWPTVGDSTNATSSPPTVSGFPSREELAAAYAQSTGRPLDTLGFWHVLGLWKLAIIGEGVLRRAQAEPSNAAPGAPITRSFIDDLVARALHVAKAEGL
jgi:aminoglycoside phosphotransferase (APT) family kinase protein